MWRRLEILDNASLSGYANTYRAPLPRTRTIGALEIVIKGVNAATSNSADAAEQKDIRASITGIKVLSGGSKVFYETNGIQNRDIMTYETGRLPWEIRTQAAGASQYALFTVPFWIEPGAREDNGYGMGLPAQMLNALDLEVEYAFDQTSATIGFASSGHQISLAAWLYDREEPDDVLANKQFRVIEHKHDYTSVATGGERFGLSRDQRKMMRRLYVHAYKVSVAEAGIISDIQVKKENDEIFMGKWDGIQAANADHCRLNWKQGMTTTAESTTDVIYTRVPNLIHGNYQTFGSANDDNTEYLTSVTTGVYTMVNTDAEVGYLNFMANEIPTLAVVDWDLFHDLAEMVSQDSTSFEAILTNAAADGEVKIVEESISRMW